MKEPARFRAKSFELYKRRVKLETDPRRHPQGFPTMTEHYSDDFNLPVIEPGQSPLHGYRGSEAKAAARGIPAGLTIAISREAGARGATIAKRAGEKLNWEVYSQDMLEYGAQNAALRQD